MTAVSTTQQQQQQQPHSTALPMEATAARGGVHEALMLADVLLAQQRLLHEHEELRRHDAQADRVAHEAQVIPIQPQTTHFQIKTPSSCHQQAADRQAADLGIKMRLTYLLDHLTSSTMLNLSSLLPSLPPPFPGNDKISIGTSEFHDANKCMARWRHLQP